MLLSWWVPVITGLAAFLGVVVGQWAQVRRDKARWKQETERWQAEREDQRQRDRDAWAREDRYRFAEYKREVYADILTKLSTLRDVVGGQIFLIDDALKHEKPISEFLPSILSMGVSQERLLELHAAAARGTLIASGDVREMVNGYLTMLATSSQRLEAADEYNLKSTMATEAMRLQGVLIDDLRDAMRAELGEIPAPDELV